MKWSDRRHARRPEEVVKKKDTNLFASSRGAKRKGSGKDRDGASVCDDVVRQCVGGSTRRRLRP